MATIEDQLALEQEMTELGIGRFRANNDEAKAKGRYTETAAGSRLIRVFLSQVSAHIAEKLSKNPAGRPSARNAYLRLLRGVDYDKLAMFTLHCVIECIYKPMSLTRVAAAIGVRVEDELRFGKFEIEQPEYYNALIRDLDRRHSTQYRHRHRVLVNRMNKKEIEWHAWTNETHIGVGLILLGCAEDASDLIEVAQKGQQKIVRPTQEVLEWIKKHEDAIEVTMPDRLPCLVPPLDWEHWQRGGFHGQRLQNITPLVKTRSGQQRDWQSSLLSSACMPKLFESVNAMQGTSWRINQRVLSTLRTVWDRGLGIGMPETSPIEIPSAPIAEGKTPESLNAAEKEAFDSWKSEARVLHSLEAERQAGLLSIQRSLRMATRMQAVDMLWIVYQCDFRSRTYSTTSGLSPQGNDVSKALLEFGEEKPLGKSGWYWFRVHGANKYGNDKGSYDERVAWVEDNRDFFIRAARDPIAHTDVWSGADKPYQFLAWLFELEAAYSTDGGPARFSSRIPVALDGACNGLQHFSAMLRDPVGGRSVNLTPSERPSDIYQDVADVATSKLVELRGESEGPEAAAAALWLNLFEKVSGGRMNRKLAKKPVMTLPYGSTLQTCTQSVHAWYLEQKIDHFPQGTAFKHSVFMAQILWRSISKVVIAARSAMDWLQKSAATLAREDHPIQYVTPIGFPMVQFSPNMERKTVSAQIGGRMRLVLQTEMPGVDIYKAKSGSSPNLVHSVDAAHMHMVVAEGARRGFTHFAMIHDDFGVHACHVEEWHGIIREQFIKLHTENDVLQQFKDQNEERTGIELPALPPKGDLDLKGVAKSLYFFG